MSGFKYIKNKTIIFFINILKNNRRIRNYLKRYFNLKRLLELNYKINHEFVFVQIGANDGISFDFLYDFVTKRNSKGIVVEPIKSYFDELVTNYKAYKNIIPINKAVHPYEKKITLYKIDPIAIEKYPDWVKGIASANPTHHLKTSINSEDILEEIVGADDLMSIIYNNLKFCDIDYFQVDTEGFDFDVIMMIDFDIFRPKIIKYERVHLIKEQEEILIAKLMHLKYYIFNEGNDTIAISLVKIKFV
jgi:FkbM family methyltransferase